MRSVPPLFPRFGQLEIIVRGNRPEEILFELSDVDHSDLGWEDGFILMNGLPMGTHPKVAQLTKEFRSGKAPDEGVLRQTVQEIIEHPEQMDRSPQGFKMQHLLQFKWMDGIDEKKKTPFEYLIEAKALLLNAIKTHTHKLLNTENSLLSGAFGQTAWLVHPEIRNADEIFLQMIKYGCIGRRK